MGLPLLGVKDQQGITKGVNFDIQPPRRFLDQAAPLLHAEEGALRRMLKNRHDDLFEHAHTTLDEVQMAIRQRVKGPWIDRNCHCPPSLRVAPGLDVSPPSAVWAGGIVAWLGCSVNRFVTRSSHCNCPQAAEISRPRLCRTKAEMPCCSKYC